MYQVSDVMNVEVPLEGMACQVKAKFYYRISEGCGNGSRHSNCYLAESSNAESPKIFLSDSVGEAIIDEDETFGMMVGGEFAYYDIDAEVDGVIKRTPEGVIFEAVSSVKLEKDGESQRFEFRES